jgi:hypothetical protein
VFRLPAPLRAVRSTRPMADALKAIAALQPADRELAAEMFRLLGYEPWSGPALTTTPRQAARRGPVEEARALAPEREPRATAAAQRKPIPAMIENLTEASSSPPPEWLGDVVLLSLAPDYTPAYRKPIPTLFDPRRQRALVLALASRLLPGAEIDLPKVVAGLARLSLSERPPRHLRRSLRAGAVAVLDIGPSMQPFLQDIDAFATEFRAVIGESAADIRYVRDPPPAGSFGADGLPSIWRPIPPGAPVVIVSDFGARRAGRGAPSPRPQAWSRFIAGLDRKAVGVAPCSPSRIALEIRERIEIVEWSREAGLHQARRRPHDAR